MATLNDIANVQIALNTAAIERADFGTPLIASPLASFSELVRTYNQYTDAEADNLPPILLTALSDAFAQIPRPNKVKVGRLSIDKVVIEPSVVTNSAVYSLKVNGTLCSYTADSSATAAEIATGIASAITSSGVTGITATAVSGTVEITYSGAVKALTDFVKLKFGTITPTAANMSADLSAIKLEDNAWYVLHLTERTQSRVQDAAAWVEANDKLFGTSSAQADILNAGLSTDVISVLGDTQYYRTFALYHSKADTEFADVAWSCRVLPIQPGAETWALKRVASVTPDKLSATNRNTIFAKGGNTLEYYQPTIALTNTGKVVAGEWIDIIRFRDWLKDTIQTNIVQMMINRDKIPYTDQGIQLVVNKLRESLRRGQEVGGIAPDEKDADGNDVPGFIITAPLSSEVDDVTKASRVLTISFNARIAGAIHVTNITGALAYSLE